MMCFAGILAMAMLAQRGRRNQSWPGSGGSIDGDTLVVRYQGESRTVRLIGLDTSGIGPPHPNPVEHFGAGSVRFHQGPAGRKDGATRPGSYRGYEGRLRPALPPRLSRWRELQRHPHPRRIRPCDSALRLLDAAPVYRARKSGAHSEAGLMGAASGRVMATTRYWGPPLPAGREPRRLAQSGRAILGSAAFYRAVPFAW